MKLITYQDDGDLRPGLDLDLDGAVIDVQALAEHAWGPEKIIIATGTPAGVGNARTPKRFLQPGDVVELEIEGVGTLCNPVATAA